MLASCATINGQPNRIANSGRPVIDEETFFQCPATRGVALPSDRQLSQWGADELWTWGENTWRWGSGCADQLALAGYLRRCEQGDRQACTYVNQNLPAKTD